MHEDIEESAKLILEHNRDTFLFWAVLIFTCVVGIIELLPEIKQPFFSVQQICLGIIYFALLCGMIFSSNRVLGIYREIRKLALSGRLGEDIEKKAEKGRTFMDKVVDSAWCTPAEIFGIAFVFIVLVLLYLAKIGVL